MIVIGNAAGWLKRPDDISGILKVPSDIVQVVRLGSYTVEPREGNPGNNFVEPLNALGLPNPGIGRAAQFLSEMIRRIRESGKIASVSIAGFSIEEYQRLARIITSLKPDNLELNLGCPNVWQGEEQKPIAAFVPELVGQIVDAVYEVTDHVGAPQVSVKLSPYSDPFLLERIARVLGARTEKFQKIVASNTFPNAYGFSAKGRPLIAQGYGGLSGYAMKHIALGQVMQFKKFLPAAQVEFAGGIACEYEGENGGEDVRDAELAGACSAQVGTAFFNRGPKVFQDIAMQYHGIGE